MNGKSEYSYEDFLSIHQHQLVQSSVPQLYWETLYQKLKGEVFDAGSCFMVQCVETEDSDEEEAEGDREPSQTWRVVVSAEEGIKCLDNRHIYLIDHAWSYRLHEARPYLEQVEGLTDRMAALMGVPTDGRAPKDVHDDVLKEMWKFNQTYSIRNFQVASTEGLPVWYVMDEFGSRIQHSDTPNFRTAPLVYGATGTAFTILWPTQDVDEGDEVTRDYVHGQDDPERRQAMLLPWQPHDFRDTPYLQEEPDDTFFSDHRIQETDYSKLCVDPGKLKGGYKLKVCVDYPDAPELTDERFEIVETGEEADILWTNKSFKDFSSLNTEQGCKFINQFPNEACVTVKDLLAVTSRRGNTRSVDADTLEGNPPWLPVTYNLNTELPQFISYFQHRQDKGLDNVWIIKPWNLSNSVDMSVSDNLNQIIRVRESGPKVACKYISDAVTLRREDLDAQVKIDIRFMVFLASINPLRLYVYRPVSIRRGHKEYALKDFDDLRRHLTYVDIYQYGTYRPGMYTEEFVPQYEKEYPEVPWSAVETKMHTMIKELFEGASSKSPPAGLADCPASRAIYGIDILLRQQRDENGTLTIQPMLSEVNFSPLYETWKENYPEMLNDAFSALFYDDIAGREDRMTWKENYPEMLNDAFSALFYDDIAGREDRIVRVAP